MATDYLAASGWKETGWLESPGNFRVEREIRDKFISQFGFAILDATAIEVIRPYAPILEIGAGSGYWSYELRRAGIDVIATDLGVGSYRGLESGWEKPYLDVERLHGEAAVKKYPARILLTVWPDLHDDWSAKALAAYTGKTVLYVGEGPGGCTATDGFHEYLAENFGSAIIHAIPNFWGIHDQLHIWSRS